MSAHGVLLVDKPSGITSHDVVARVRRWLGIKAVGHAGTLDPMATGLLVLLVGEATKISDYLLRGNKGYQLKLKLGIETDSLDITGEVLQTKSTEYLELTQIQKCLNGMVGELELAVPKFSAIKVKGKKLLEKARANENFEVPTRSMEFFDLSVHGFNKSEIECEFYCSKGSYVRSWVNELGKQLGCGATLTELRRIFSAPYSVEKATPLTDLETSSLENCPSFIPLESCLEDWEAVTVCGRDEVLMRNGQIPVSLAKRLIFQQKMVNRRQQALGIRVFQGSSGTLSSLLEVQPNRNPKIKRVFRY